MAATKRPDAQRKGVPLNFQERVENATQKVLEVNPGISVNEAARIAAAHVMQEIEQEREENAKRCDSSTLGQHFRYVLPKCLESDAKFRVTVLGKVTFRKSELRQ
ncbi:MAG: hypothetical protein OXI05_00640 [Bacteroidota bacterium]|nr:hypothetical protein [Bacteroidota bacterium]MXW14056.1 hypothetical protein [Rhodothermaceae bacterium]MDE2644332.1 hypothetical protein [Bacteroidota bacterium]MXW32632.1 hypothetical protein [Rhodothermaceae bacterium]MXZ17241.1 hypothetical protein [Rhodothermaceae bacterium]